MDTDEMAFHRKLFNAVDQLDGDCELDDCTCRTDVAARAMLAVIWIHCPAEWYRSVWVGRTDMQVSDGLCVTCKCRYPCRNITAIAEEFNLTWVAPDA